MLCYLIPWFENKVRYHRDFLPVWYRHPMYSIGTPMYSIGTPMPRKDMISNSAPYRNESSQEAYECFLVGV